MTDFRPKVTKSSGKDRRPNPAVETAFAWATKFRPRLWLAMALAVAGFTFGTPHLLVTYHCYGKCRSDYVAYACDYIGIGGWRENERPVRERCPVLRLLR